MLIQVTLISRKGYKPLSTIVNLPKAMDYEQAKQEAKSKGIEKICIQRSMTIQSLRKYEYFGMKMRQVEEEKK